MEIKEEVLDRWWSACVRAGLVEDLKENMFSFYQHSVDVKGNCSAGDYLAKQDSSKHWGTDHEMAKATSKSGKRSGLHPFAFLTDESKNPALWLEYTRAIKGKSQLFWSHGLKEKFGIGAKTDEEIAEEEADQAVLLGRFTFEEWRLVRKHEQRANILNIVENEEDTVRTWALIKEVIFYLKLGDTNNE